MRRLINDTETLTVIYLLSFIQGLIGYRVSFKMKIVELVPGLLGLLFEFSPSIFVTVLVGCEIFPYHILLIFGSNQYFLPSSRKIRIELFQDCSIFSIQINSLKGYAVEDFQQKDMAIMSLSSFQPMVIYMTLPLLRQQ